MWNPFRSVKLKAILPAPTEDIIPAAGNDDPKYAAELKRAQKRSDKARAEIALIHENLAAKALDQFRGGAT